MESARARLGTAVCLFCMLGMIPAAAQSGRSRGGVQDKQAFCSCVEVEKTQLSNAAIVTITANGLMKTDADRMDFMQEDDPGEYETKPVTRLPIRIENARSELGSFVDINLYPISHLEITLLPNAQEGIGLELSVVLFTPGYARRIDLGDFEYEGYLRSTTSNGMSNVPVEIVMSDDQRSIIVIARSDRYIDVERSGQTQRIDTPNPELEVRYRNSLMDVHAVGTTATQLLNEIGRQTGTRISLANESPAVASLHLNGMTLPQTLNTVARAYGLVLGRIDGGYALAPGWPESGAAYHFAHRQSFPVHYLKAEAAANLFPNALDRYIQVDRDHNALVATGAPAMLDKIAEDLALLDRPSPMIETEALVVDMARGYDLSHALGLQFSDGTTSFGVDPARGDIAFRILQSPMEHVHAVLSALEEEGTVNTHVRAKVKASNGQYARVFGGALQYFPYRTTPRWNRRQEITLSRIEVGIRLSGWFYTSGDDVILSRFYLRANNITDVSPEGLPRLATRYMRSNVQLVHGDTLFIGGLTTDERMDRHSQISGLGDLPYAGEAFRSRDDQKNKRALAVFLTVRIVESSKGEILREPPAVDPEDALDEGWDSKPLVSRLEVPSDL